jgi:alpha-mannosidase
LGEAWDAVLFNTFHDVLPGTAIERALEGQRAWLGLARHQAARAENDALNALAARVDTRVPRAAGDRPALSPVLLWNPDPHPFDGPVEFEAPLDYRPLDAFKNRPDAVPLEVRDGAGRALPFQCVAVENDFALETPWRKRFVARVKIPPCGWHVLTAGLADAPARAPRVETDLRAGAGRIANRAWEVRADARAGRVVFLRKGKTPRRAALRVLTVDDPWGSWGGHDGEPEANHVNRVKSVWKIESAAVLERGPERAALRVRLADAGGASWLELTLLLHRGDGAVVARVRAFWAERAARLKLEFSGIGGAAEFEVPGGGVRREPCGDVPGGRWVRFGGGRGALVFASDALYCFDATESAFGATVARSAPYASLAGVRAAAPAGGGAAAGFRQPVMDLGEHLFQFALGAGGAGADALARRLESPPVALLTAAHAGPLARTGGVLRAGPGLRLLAFARAASGDGWMLRVQGAGPRAAEAAVEFLGGRVSLGKIEPGRIRTVILRRGGGGGGQETVCKREAAAGAGQETVCKRKAAADAGQGSEDVRKAAADAGQGSEEVRRAAAGTGQGTACERQAAAGAWTCAVVDCAEEVCTEQVCAEGTPEAAGRANL